jgi:hypothetical protein
MTYAEYLRRRPNGGALARGLQYSLRGAGIRRSPPTRPRTALDAAIRREVINE